MFIFLGVFFFQAVDEKSSPLPQLKWAGVPQRLGRNLLGPLLVYTTLQQAGHQLSEVLTSPNKPPCLRP